MEELVRERNIEHLVHFTRAKNLASILKYGLLPIDVLKKLRVTTIINDFIRLDNYTNATSVSVEFPNYKMLLKLRRENKEEDWAIIFIRKEILFDKKCAYCYENASSEMMRDIPLERKFDIKMFEKMFEDIDGMPSRSEKDIKRYFTTSAQAEILVFDIIEPKYFDKIVFIDSNALKMYSKCIPKTIKCEVIPDYFYAREDYI